MTGLIWVLLFFQESGMGDVVLPFVVSSGLLLCSKQLEIQKNKRSNHDISDLQVGALERGPSWMTVQINNKKISLIRCLERAEVGGFRVPSCYERTEVGGLRDSSR